METIRLTPLAVNRLEWSVWLVSWVALARWADRAVARADLAQQVGYRALTVAGAVLLVHLYRGALAIDFVLWKPAPFIAWTMDAIVAAGFAFTWWARVHLGALWSSHVTRKAHHHVVDTGPYGIVRHPIYTGLAVAVIATFVMSSTIASALGAALLVSAFYVKARVEERFLREQLGSADYDAYAKRVPMLIPWPT